MFKMSFVHDDVSKFLYVIGATPIHRSLLLSFAIYRTAFIEFVAVSKMNVKRQNWFPHPWCSAGWELLCLSSFIYIIGSIM